MAFFESGISDYVHAIAKVDIYFPVDHRGNAHIRCDQCFFYRESSHSCALTHEPSTFPTKWVGATCPLMSVDDEQAKRIETLFSEIAQENANKGGLATENE